MPKRGLPETIRMRHDEHYVEALTSSAGSPIGRMIPIDQIDPNPNQPRQVMGDLSELMASIAEKGIIEPIIVRQRGNAVPDHRRRTPLPGRDPGRPQRDSDRHPRGRRQRDHRGRARREPAAQGSDGVRRSRSAAFAGRPGATTRTRTWRGGWGSRERPLRSRCRSMRCPKRSKTFVGWPTFTLSRCFYR